MTDLAYLPLKTPDGQLAGHARVAPGSLTVRLRRPLGGQTVALTDSGCFFGAPESVLPISGALRAVGVETHGHLLCFGVAPDGAGAEAELRRRLMAAQAPTASAPVQAAAAAVTARPAADETARPLPASAPAAGREAAMEPQQDQTPSGKAAPANAPQQNAAPAGEATGATAAADVPQPSVPVSAVFPERFAAPEPSHAQPLPGAARTAPEAPPFPAQEPQPSVPASAVFPERFADTPAEPALESVEASAADSSAFMALLRRADAVFQRLEAPAPAEAGPARRDVLAEKTIPARGWEDTPRDAAMPPPSRCDGRDRSKDGPAFQSGWQEAPPHPPQRDGAAPANRRRDAWSEQVDAILEMPASVERDRLDNPFPHIFPNAVFSRVRGGSVMEHLEGDWLDGGVRRRILAVRGDYAPQPPKHLFGFTRYIRTRSGGYWVKVL